MLAEIERLGRVGVALDELETMRAGLKSSLIMAQESSMSRSGSLASDWFFLGRVRPIEEIAAELDALTPAAVSEYAASLQANGEPTIVTLGPTPCGFRLDSATRDGAGPVRASGIASTILDLLLGTVEHHAISPHDARQRARGHRRAERPGALGRRRVLRQGGQPRRVEPSVAGVSHFLEHMTFKGTPRRDAVAVNRDFDRVGAKHNAQTSEEDTFYHVTCLPEYLPQVVRRSVRHPPADAPRVDDFETEKQVIIEEIRMYLDNPMSVAYEAAKTAHFGTHPLGNSILGTVESITRPRGRPDARLLRAGGTARPTSCWHSPARPTGSELVELAQRALRRLAGRRRDPADAVPFRGIGVIPGDPPRRRPAADRRRRLRRAAARERRPLRRAPAGDHPGRPHRLAALLDADRSRAWPTAPSFRTRTTTRPARSSPS